MRLAVISDTHGNSLALQAVLDRLANEPADLIVCLGDLAVMGFDPAGTIELVAELGCPVVRGNTDDFLINGFPDGFFAQGDAAIRHDIADWTMAQITPSHLAFLDTLAPSIDVDLDGLKICCYHGSPTSYNDPILPDTPDEQLEAWFSGIDAPILIGGHTHRQMLRRWNGRTIINPGPVSLTFERLPAGQGTRVRPWTEYAILTNADGDLRIDFRYLPLDLDALATAAHASGMPHAEWWLKEWE